MSREHMERSSLPFSSFPPFLPFSMSPFHFNQLHTHFLFRIIISFLSLPFTPIPSFYIHSTAFQSTSIPIHLQLPHHSSTHSHTTSTTQFRSNTYNPFCVELGTPNTNNSRKLLDLCVCLFKAHTFFYSTCLVSLTSTSRILLVSCSARAKSLSCLTSFRRIRLCT